jgi:FkbM family methyltransferase
MSEMLPTGQSLAGKALRLPLRLIPKSSVARVVFGPMRGAKWIVGSSTHGCWLGSYEREKQECFASLIRPGTVVYDIGANVGLYSVLAARRGARLVLACEPDPSNVRILSRHWEMNHIHGFIEQAAVADYRGNGNFACRGAEGRISDIGIEVSVTTVDVLAEQHHFPDIIKIDVEGSELNVLKGAIHSLRSKPAVFVAQDGPIEPVLEFMSARNYKAHEIMHGEWLFK